MTHEELLAAILSTLDKVEALVNDTVLVVDAQRRAIDLLSKNLCALARRVDALDAAKRTPRWIH